MKRVEGRLGAASEPPFRPVPTYKHPQEGIKEGIPGLIHLRETIRRYTRVNTPQGGYREATYPGIPPGYTGRHIQGVHTTRVHKEAYTGFIPQGVHREACTGCIPQGVHREAWEALGSLLTLITQVMRGSREPFSVIYCYSRVIEALGSLSTVIPC